MNDVEKALRKMVAEDAYMQFLGIEFLEIGQERTVARIRYKKEVTNLYGTFHGGSLYSLADITAGTAASMGGYYVTTVSGNMNFMLPAKETEYVYCEALNLRAGKHLAVYELKLTDGEGRLFDSGEFTFFVTAQKVTIS